MSYSRFEVQFFIPSKYEKFLEKKNEYLIQHTSLNESLSINSKIHIMFIFNDNVFSNLGKQFKLFDFYLYSCSTIRKMDILYKTHEVTNHCL